MSKAKNKAVNVIKHPLIQHKLTHMRMKGTPPGEFRALLREIAMLMAYEITREMPMSSIVIETPLATIPEAPVVADSNVVVVPILRAGLGMTDGLLELLPAAHVGHIGVYRDPTTHRPVEYYAKLPPYPAALHLLVDPMLATGYSAVHAADVMNKLGVADTNIRFMVLVAAPEGIDVFHNRHPNIPIYAAAVDDHLNEKDYIIPGLGDAGDRIFGTL